MNTHPKNNNESGLLSHPEQVPLVSDLDTIGLSCVLLYFAVMGFVRARILAQHEEESLKNLETK